MRCLKLLLFCVIVMVLTAGMAFGEVPHLINLQGYLVDDQGPVTGIYEATFRIYDDPDAGNILWEETDSVEVDNGLYSQALGETATINISWEGDRWIGVQFAGHPEMTPRYRQTAVPYTFLSEFSDSSGTVSDNAITGVKILDGTVEPADLSFTPLSRPLSPGVTTDEIADNAVTSGKISDGTIQPEDLSFLPVSRPITPGVATDEIANEAVTEAKILDGTIGFADIGQNGALDGQVMKWNDVSNSWIAANDQIGGGTGWNWSDSSSYGPDSVQFSYNSVYTEVSDSAESITDGAIDFADIGQNGAVDGQVIKWNTVSGGWIAANDETGGGGSGGGWMDDGNVVRLETTTDSVGIGTATPTEKLAVEGNIFVSGKATIGPRNTNIGYYAYVAGDSNAVNGYVATIGGGYHNTASANYSVVGGGANNTASANTSVVSGGNGNTASGHSSAIGGGISNTAGGTNSAISGGQGNTVAGDNAFIGSGINNDAAGINSAVVSGYDNAANGWHSFIGGGQINVVNGEYSAVLGGSRNTIDSSANYSYLFGINSTLTQDSTFMVDLPHIRFGDEFTGYEFPANDGGSGQVMSTDGNGQLSWVDMGGGGSGNGWVDDGTVVRLETGTDNVGIGLTNPTAKLDILGDLKARKGNLGFQNTNTGDDAFVAGYQNEASGLQSSVVGGFQNSANATRSLVGGGSLNTVDGAYSAVLGGAYNHTDSDYGTIGSGRYDTVHAVGGGVLSGLYNIAGDGAVDSAAFVGGGRENTAQSKYSVVAGGKNNMASNEYAAVSGGRANSASNSYSTISGGYANSTSGDYGVVGGGNTNNSGSHGFVGGGYSNISDGEYSVVTGGSYNIASGAKSFIGGGDSNSSPGQENVIGGGNSNVASANQVAISGGAGHTVSSNFGAIGGGQFGVVSGSHSGVFSGYANQAGDEIADSASFVGGGRENSVKAKYAFIGGGTLDTVNSTYGGISAGYNNIAGDAPEDTAVFIGGGMQNRATWKYNFIGGGYNNTAEGNFGIIVGGEGNLIDRTWGNDHNIICGGKNNVTNDDYNIIVGGSNNLVAYGNYASIVSGDSNYVFSEYGTVLNGRKNTIESDRSTIFGGNFNQIRLNSEGSLILGGNYNIIDGQNTLIFGNLVNISRDNVVAFYSENYPGSIALNRTDPYVIDQPIRAGTFDHGGGGGAYLSDLGVWTDISLSRMNLTDRDIQQENLLLNISNLSLHIRESIETREKHFGPTAEDFVAAFDVGTIRESDGQRDNQYLAASDVAGVALAGVQELIKKIESLEKRNEELEKRISELEKR